MIDADITAGQSLRVVRGYRRSGVVHLKEGQTVVVAKVSQTGLLIIAGLSGFWHPDRFEPVAGEGAAS